MNLFVFEYMKCILFAAFKAAFCLLLLYFALELLADFSKVSEILNYLVAK